MKTCLHVLMAGLIILAVAALGRAAPPANGNGHGNGHGDAGLKGILYTEAQRQHSVRQQVDGVIGSFKTLVDDLDSNGLLKQGGGPELERVAKILSEVNTTNVPAAARQLEEARKALTELRSHLSNVQGAHEQIGLIIEQLNRILRDQHASSPAEDLASMLRLLIEQEKAALSTTKEWGLQVLQKLPQAEARKAEVSNQQAEVAQGYGKFKDKLDKAVAGEADPMRKPALEAAQKLGAERKVDQLLTTAVRDIDARSPIQATARQQDALKTMQEMLKLLEPNDLFDQLQQMKDAKQQLEEILKDQTALREKTQTSKPEQFEKEKPKLQADQRNLERRLEQVETPPLEKPTAQPEARQPEKQPEAKPPEAKQPDAKQPEKQPDAQEKAREENAQKSTDPVKDAKEAMASAEQKIEQAQKDPAAEKQKDAEAMLQEAIKRLDEQINNLEQQLNNPAQDTLAKLDELIKEQKDLKEKTQQQANKKEDAKPLSQPQKDLEHKAQDVRADTANPGMQQVIEKPLEKAAEEMKKAADELAKNDPKKAEAAQEKAVEALEKAREAAATELAKQTEMMNQLQELMQAQNQVNALAQKQQQLANQTNQSAPKELPKLNPPQQQLGQETKQTAEQVPQAAKPLEKAAEAMNQAAQELQQGDKPEAQAQEQAALDALNQASQELGQQMQQLAQQMGMTPSQQQAMMPSPPMPIPGMVPAPAVDPQKGLQREFNEKANAGKAQSGDARWTSLGQRDRQQLNQRFARELPAEYRELLQDYYSALAK